MIKTLFIFGPSDIEGQNPITSTSPEKGGVRVTADLQGVLPILPYVMNDQTLRANSAEVMVGVHQIRLPENASVNLFNLVGDADSSSNMLLKIQHIANELQPRRFFNQPSHVFRSSRGRLPKTLGDIPGCVVPRVEIANPKTFAELQAVCERFDRWPIIVRARGYHGGENMVLVSDAAQLESIENLSWLYRGIFLIEFFDFKNADGLYQKIRVVMVDGIPYLRHCIISDKWAIHTGSRAELMDQDIELCYREEKFLAQFCEAGLKQYGQIFREIHRRMGLDVFGIDFALVNGQMVLFEANPCMSFLGDRYGNDDRYQYLDQYVNALRRAIKRMLVTS